MLGDMWELADKFEGLLTNMEKHDVKRHAKAVVKELLLVSRALTDSLLDTLEREDGSSAGPRKIKITLED